MEVSVKNNEEALVAPRYWQQQVKQNSQKFNRENHRESGPRITLESQSTLWVRKAVPMCWVPTQKQSEQELVLIWNNSQSYTQIHQHRVEASLAQWV